MEFKIRTFHELDYFERHIFDVLIEEFGRNKEEALTILNEYANLLKILKDEHETAYSFAEIFDDAYRSGTSATAWLDNIVNHLIKSAPEIEAYCEFLSQNNAKFFWMIDGTIMLNQKKYVRIYLGEEKDSHVVRFRTYCVNLLNPSDNLNEDELLGEIATSQEL